MILNVGTLALSAVMAEGADPVPDGLGWDIYGEPNAEGERKKADYSYDAQPKSRLTAGKYLVSVTRGAASAKAEVEVTAGKTTTQVVNLNAGTLQLIDTAGNWRSLARRTPKETAKNSATRTTSSSRSPCPPARRSSSAAKARKKPSRKSRSKPTRSAN